MMCKATQPHEAVARVHSGVTALSAMAGMVCSASEYCQQSLIDLACQCRATVVVLPCHDCTDMLYRPHVIGLSGATKGQEDFC